MKKDETLPKRYREVFARNRDLPISLSKNRNGVFEPLSYGEAWRRIRTLAFGLKSLGISRGDHVGIMSDNRTEWILTDIALLCLGAADVPRGSDSTADEMAYILHHADCRFAFAENRIQAEKILSKRANLPLLEMLVLFDGSQIESLKEAADGVKILQFDEVHARGEREAAADPGFFDREIDMGKTDDLATIIYTSGTTGEPKGVMLHHRSFLFQIEAVPSRLHLQAGQVFFSVLPFWHSFERAVEYYVLDSGASIAYSKPIGKIMLEDMEKVRPQWMTSVPRIWEGVKSAIFRKVNSEGGAKKIVFHFLVAVGEFYSLLKNMILGRLPQFQRRNRIIDIVTAIIPFLIVAPLKGLGDILVFKAIKEKLGGRFIVGVSGGGALPPHVDRFFEAAGIKLLEGYGLTEAGPILGVRKQDAPVPGTGGPLLPGVEYSVRTEEGAVLQPNRKGVLHVRSPQVMLGYYKRPEETAKVLKDGWLDTGDLAVFTYGGECKIVGRQKETIVLLGGENIEPTPIEETLVQSEFIEQAMVVGQDKKFLGALIVPNLDKLESFAAQKEIAYVAREDLLFIPEIQEQIHDEIQSLVNPKKGFKTFERIFRFKLLPKKFEVGRELTQTMKIRRNVVNELYKHEIASLFKEKA